MSIDRGEQVTLSCTYRTAQQGLPTIMWTAPPEILIIPATTQIDADTLQSAITFNAATSSYARDYQCIAAVGSDSFSSDPATLTVNCKFKFISYQLLCVCKHVLCLMFRSDPELI